MPKITKKVVDAAAARDADYVIWDDTLTGFGLRVRASGGRSYIVSYRMPGEGRRGTFKRVTIAAVGKITPEQARLEARKILGSIAHGEDVAVERTRERKAATFSDVAAAFMREHVETKRKPATVEKYGYILDAILLPAFGRKKPAEITRAAVAALHHENADRPSIANYALAVLSAVFTHGQKMEVIPEGLNPTRFIERFPEEGRERYLTTAELERLGEALIEAETIGLPWTGANTEGKGAKHLAKPENRLTRFDPAAVAAVRLLALTGCRLREILHLQWQDVDFERGILFLPDSKTGKKPVILNAPALTILQSLPERSRYVIPGLKEDQPRADLKKLWAALQARAGLRGVRIHDLRHSYASFGVGGGMGLPIVGKLLGHKRASTTEKYAHLDVDPLRRASNRIGTTIAAALEGSEKAPVIDIQQTRQPRSI